MIDRSLGRSHPNYTPMGTRRPWPRTLTTGSCSAIMDNGRHGSPSFQSTVFLGRKDGIQLSRSGKLTLSRKRAASSSHFRACALLREASSCQMSMGTCFWTRATRYTNFPHKLIVFELPRRRSDARESASNPLTSYTPGLHGSNVVSHEMYQVNTMRLPLCPSRGQGKRRLSIERTRSASSSLSWASVLSSRPFKRCCPWKNPRLSTCWVSPSSSSRMAWVSLPKAESDRCIGVAHAEQSRSQEKQKISRCAYSNRACTSLQQATGSFESRAMPRHELKEVVLRRCLGHSSTASRIV